MTGLDWWSRCRVREAAWLTVAAVTAAALSVGVAVAVRDCARDYGEFRTRQVGSPGETP